MDARTRAWLDQEDARLKAIVRDHGWFIVHVGSGRCGAPACSACGDDDGPVFAYTVGLFGLGNPELLLFGAAPEQAAAVLNTLGERIRAGADLMPEQQLSLPVWPHRVVPEDVPNAGAIVFDANRFYARPDDHSVPVLQLGYGDGDGRFPWEAGYDGPPQPRPGTFAA